MTCGIFSPFVNASNFLEISEPEFAQATLAKRNLAHILAIEEKFDLVLENFIEFERELLDVALHEMVGQNPSWSSIQFDIHKVNRRLANLLSAARLYRDQLKHDVAALDNSGASLLGPLEEQLSKEYDAKLGFRVMEALRNYAQHRSLPVHELTYARSWEPKELPNNLVFRIVPAVSVQELREDASVKTAVLQELEAIDESVPLTPLVREYVEGLSAVHERFRKLTDSSVNQWEEIFRQIHDRGAREFGGRRGMLLLIRTDEKGVRTEEEAVLQGYLDHRKELVRKNANFANLSARFVSGACDLHES